MWCLIRVPWRRVSKSLPSSPGQAPVSVTFSGLLQAVTSGIELGVAGGYPKGYVEKLQKDLSALPKGQAGRTELPPAPAVVARARPSPGRGAAGGGRTTARHAWEWSWSGRQAETASRRAS